MDSLKKFQLKNRLSDDDVQSLIKHMHLEFVYQESGEQHTEPISAGYRKSGATFGKPA